MKTLIAIVAALLLSGCVSSHILVGQRRPPISPDQVQVYLDPPAQFEKIAVLESNNRASFAFTQQQKTNKVVERLKAEAAALGANGILLHGVGDQYAGSVGVANAWANAGSAFAVGTSSATYMRVGSGIAIYVPPQAAAISAIASSAEPIAESVTLEKAAPRPNRAAQGAPRPVERDPAKRCDACKTLSIP